MTWTARQIDERSIDKNRVKQTLTQRVRKIREGRDRTVLRQQRLDKLQPVPGRERIREKNGIEAVR